MAQSRKKLRDCPAVQRGISPAECGENRCSRYSCPEQCPYNPWSSSQYEQGLDIGLAALEKMNRRAEQEAGGYPLIHPSSYTAAETARWRHGLWFTDRNTQGSTLYERWEKAGVPGLNNDQQVFIKALSRCRTALLEIVGFESDHAILAQDRLDPTAPPLLVLDKSSTQGLGRFDRLLAWVVCLPHYHRITGIALTIPSVGDLEAEDIVGGVATMAGGPGTGEPLRTWLHSKMPLMEEAFASIHEAMRRKSFENLTYTYLSYKVNIPRADFINDMNARHDVVSDPVTEKDRSKGITHQWTWLTPPEHAPDMPHPDGGKPVLGRLTLSQDGITAEGGNERIQLLQSILESRIGKSITLVSTRMEEAGRQLLIRNAQPCNMSLVPPAFLDHALKLATQTYMIPSGTSRDQAAQLMGPPPRWADEPLESLGQLTPRQASANPQWRPALLRMMKSIINRADHEAMKNGFFKDYGILAGELGLQGLAAQPPPAATAAASRRPPSRELSPSLMERNLSHDEILSRLDQALDIPDTYDDVMRDMMHEAAPLLDWIGDYPATLWTEDETLEILRYMAMTWLILFPNGSGPLMIDIDRLDAQYESLMTHLSEDGESSKVLLMNCLYPELYKTITLLWMEAGTEEHGAHLTGKVSEMRAFGPILFYLAINELILAAQEE